MSVGKLNSVRFGIGPDDVLIADMPERDCEECGEALATKLVSLDLRAMGMEVPLSACCEGCATVFIERLREDLTA